MFEHELKSLFSPQEYAHFLEYMENEHYFWEKNKFCHSGYILGFISRLEDELRKSSLIEICISRYPQVLGIIPGI